uniref:Uncharacterized protein n=2 Tax=Myripristis murdjan TaxID=586833 RepID=A0A667Y3R4_9TELE
MSLVSLTMFVEVTRAIPAQHETGEEVRREYQSLVPLSDASEPDKVGLYNLQINLKCCGLEQGHQDWDNDIPESCICTEHATVPCVEAPKNSSLYVDSIDNEPIMIYKEPCLPIFIGHVHMAITIIIGILFGLTLMWALSAGLCAVMLYQLRRKFDVPPVVYSPEAKAGNYTTLTESAENA